jgi:hypothetical protein
MGHPLYTPGISIVLLLLLYFELLKSGNMLSFFSIYKKYNSVFKGSHDFIVDQDFVVQRSSFLEKLFSSAQNGMANLVQRRSQRIAIKILFNALWK